MGRHHPIFEGLDWKKKKNEGRANFLSLLELECSFICSCHWTLVLLVLGPLDSGTYTNSSLVLRPLDLDWIIPPAFLVLHLAEGNLVTQFYNKSPPSLYVCVCVCACVCVYTHYWFCFSGEAWLNTESIKAFQFSPYVFFKWICRTALVTVFFYTSLRLDLLVFIFLIIYKFTDYLTD